MSQSEVARAAALELVASEHITVCFSTPARQKPSEDSGFAIYWCFSGSSKDQHLGSIRNSARSRARQELWDVPSPVRGWPWSFCLIRAPEPVPWTIWREFGEETPTTQPGGSGSRRRATNSPSSSASARN